MDIEFDPDKDRPNREKHGFSLEFAANVLADTKRPDILDVRFDHAKERYVSYGMIEERVWVCVYALRDEVRRISL